MTLKQNEIHVNEYIQKFLYSVLRDQTTLITSEKGNTYFNIYNQYNNETEDDLYDKFC